MRKSLINRVIEAGIHHDMPEYLKRRLVPANIISLVMLFGIAIPFVFITIVYFPSLVIYPVLGAVVTSISIIINHYGGLKYSRFIISFAPILLGAIYNAYLSGPEDDPLPSLYLIELSFALIPYVVFDLKEKGFLILCTIFCACVIITFPMTKFWFDSPYDSTVLRSGWLSTLAISLAILGEVGLILGLAYINRKSEEKSNKLLLDMDEKNQDLVESQNKLEENLQKVEQAQEEEKRRNWAAQGIASLSDILRKNEDSINIYDKTIAMIVNYVKANQAGLFVVSTNEETNDVCIVLQSCYAYSRKKYEEKEFEPGQGLIGQAYLEKEFIHLTKLPQDYVSITSGLGESTPSSLLILPLIVNDTVEGIIEIASFKDFEPYQIEFLTKIGETLAAFIQSNRVNVRTNQLLAEAKEQAEELRAQEEEMRQNMEELSATQEELSRKENEYQKVIETLREENKQLKGVEVAIKTNNDVLNS